MAVLDHYDVLEVDPNASPADIKAAFRRLAKERHPDLCAAEDAAEQFRQLRSSYEILSDAKRREHFDWVRNQRSSPAPKARPKSRRARTSSDGGRGEGRRRREYRRDVAQKTDAHGKENTSGHVSRLEDLEQQDMSSARAADNSKVTLYVAVTLLILVSMLLMLAK